MEQQAAQLDYNDRQAIIQHMRELISLGPLLLNGFEYEWSRLWSLLSKHGWSNEHLKAMEEKACEWTIYERILPRPDAGGRDR